MNPANVRELLTAAVDGELTPAERKIAQRLLEQSASARALFAQLKADAARLKTLPRVAAPADLADNVLGIIRERAMTPTPLPPEKRAGSKFNWAIVPVWVNLATAAGVLIVISIGSYMYFSESHNYFAHRSVRDKQAIVKVDGDSLPAKPGDASPLPPNDAAVDPGREAIVERPRDVSPEIGPSPRVVPSDIIAGPPDHDIMPEIEPFHLDKIRVSHLFEMRELAKDESLRKKLATEMKKDELIRLDLFCQATPKALDHVIAALKSRGITAFSDAFVQERFKKKLTTEVMIFTEAMTPDEVAQLLTTLGVEDAKSGAGDFDTLVAAPFLPADLNRLSRMLGASNVLPKPAKDKPQVDIRKPLPEGTANQLANALAKMGSGSPKPGNVAVVVAYSPMNGNPAASKEIKQFLDRRGDRKKDAKPLMLVLRTIK